MDAPETKGSVLVIGADSDVGQALTLRLRHAGWRVTGTTRRDKTPKDDRLYLDLGEGETIEAAFKQGDWDWVVILAALTGHDLVAFDIVRSERVNVTGPIQVAQQSRDAGTRVLFFSSGAVHDGTLGQPDENAACDPVLLYGQQKYRAEQAIRQLDDRSVIVRPGKILTPRFSRLLQWRDEMRKGREVEAFSDYPFSPIGLPETVDFCLALLADATAKGIYQIGSRDQISYAEAAVLVARMFDLDVSLVTAVSARQKDPSLFVPSYATQSLQRASEEIGFVPPSAIAVIERYCQTVHDDRQG